MINQQTAVLVLGMHRSGTSALTGALGFLGVDLGNHLMPAVPGENPKGFFEHMPVYELNEKILKSLHKAWWSLGEVDLAQVGELQRFRNEACDLIRRDFGDSPIFAFKDPRSARLLPFWLSVLHQLDIEVVTLLSIRSPLAVYKSLSKRNHFSRIKSYILWSRHYLGILKALSAISLVVHYDELIERPSASLAAIGELLGRPLDRQALAEVATTFIDPELRHSRAGTFGQDRLEFVNRANELYRALRDVHLRPTTTDIFSNLCVELQCDLEQYRSVLDEYDQWGSELPEVKAANEVLRSRTNDLEHRVEVNVQQASTLVGHHAQLTAQLGLLSEELTTAIRRCNELQSDVHEAQSRVTGLEAQLGKAESGLAQVSSQRDQAGVELGQIQSRLSHAESCLVQAESQLAHWQSQFAEAKSHLAEARSQLEEARSQRDEAQSQLGVTLSQLGEAHSQLAGTQTQLADTQYHLVRSENELQLSRNHTRNIEALGQISKEELLRVQAEVAELRAAQSRLAYRWAANAYQFLEHHPRLKQSLATVSQAFR